MDFKEYLYLEKTRWKKEVAPEKQGALGRKIAAQEDDPLAKKMGHGLEKPGSKPSRTIALSDPDDRPLRSLASKERPTPSRRSTDKPKPKPKPQTTATATATDTKKGSPFQPPPGTPKIMLNAPGKPKSPDPGAAAGQSSTSPKKPSPVVDPMRAYVGRQTAKPATKPTPKPAPAPAPASPAPQRGGILRRLAGVSGRLAGGALRTGGRLAGKTVSSAVKPGGLIRQAALAAALPPETRSSELLRRWRQYRGKTKPKGKRASTTATVDAPAGTEGTR